MIPSFYSLENIQHLAFVLRERATYLDSLLMGESSQALTPALIIDAFDGLDEHYEFLKTTVNNVKFSIESGHDPHRELLLPDESDCDRFSEILSPDTVSFVTFGNCLNPLV